MDDKKRTQGQKLSVSILIFMISLAALISVTTAWFSIADFTKVNSMRMEITTGLNMRFDLDSHEFFDDYCKTLSFQQIADRIHSERQFDVAKTPLEPVTTKNYMDFSYEDGTLVKGDSGAYLEFELHFMATTDMYVHLTTENSEGQTDGTMITSKNDNLPQAMRIAFATEEGIFVYDPGMENRSIDTKEAKIFGLENSSKMQLNDDNKLFYLPKDTDVPVTVRIWLEGTDELCTDDLRKADYSIRLRFVGTDENNEILDSTK